MKPANFLNLRKALHRFFVLSFTCTLSFTSTGQRSNEQYAFQKELEQTSQLIVMLSVDYDGESTGVGAGIIFANEKDRLLIVTASHVIQKGANPAKNITIRLKSAPEKSLKAVLLKQINKGESLDLAVLSVDNLASQGINACAFPFDRLRQHDNLERRNEVIPVGNPNGRSWALAVDADKISEINESEIIFESNNIKSGHSGGALIDTKANLIGMVTADEAPLGHAMTMTALLVQLRQWKFPVLLTYTNFREDRYDLPMHVAADSGNVAEVKRLIALCHNPNQVDYHYRTPLHYAASNGNIGAMSVLIKAGAMLDVQDFNEMSPLNLAVSGNHSEAVKFLVKAGANINKKTFSRMTALHWSLRKRINPQIPMYLIQAGADVNVLDEEKDSPLHMAVSMKNIEIAKALIKAGADMEAVNNFRTTPLGIAVINDDLQMIQLFISAGAAVKQARGSKAETALHKAVSFSKNAETIKMLLKAGADVNAKDETNNTALHNAVPVAMNIKDSSNNFLEFISLLLIAGADPNAKNDEGFTPAALAKEIAENSSQSSDQTKKRLAQIQNILAKYGGR